MIAYASVSCAMLRRRTRTAVLLRDNIRQSERVSAPFTFGIFRPEIFLPFGVGEREAGYMIAHEKAHIARRDNIIKPASFLLLSVYWFNPVIWAAYILMCRDIEFACDERVVRSLSPQEKADYSPGDAFVQRAAHLYRGMPACVQLGLRQTAHKESARL